MTFNLLLLLFVVLIVLSIVYSTAKLGISPMPSSRKAYQAMVALIGETGTGPIVDLGSGWGNFIVPIAKHYPQRQVEGYELSLLPWLVSVVLKRVYRLENLTLHRKDFLKADLSGASVLVCYLYPGAMKRIEDKLRQEKPKMAYLVSNNFALPSWKADKVITISDFYRSPVYLYRLDKVDN